MLSQELVLNLFTYIDGDLIWKNHPNKRYNGKIAGTKRKDGYKQLKIFQKLYRLHRVIFLYHYGYMPEIVDHIDNNNTNNLIENLRESNKSLNQWNRKINKNSISKIKGVRYSKEKDIWSCSIRKNNIYIYLGCYKSVELAENAVKIARLQYHGNHARNC